MGWIKVDDALIQHPKVLKLQALLGARADAIGLLVRLWVWASHYAQDGDLTKHDELDVRIACGMTESDVDILGLLTRCRFVDDEDGALHLHGWHEHQGRLIELRERNARREKERRGRHVDAPCAPRASHAAPKAGQDSQAKPSQAKTPQQEAVGKALAMFEESMCQAPEAGALARWGKALGWPALYELLDSLAMSGDLSKGTRYIAKCVTNRAQQIEQDNAPEPVPEEPWDGCESPTGQSKYSRYYHRRVKATEWRPEAELLAELGPAQVTA